jgi:hypothetical protein
MGESVSNRQREKYKESFPHRDGVAMLESKIKIVIPVQAGIQNLLKIPDSVSRFDCTE